ncbi:MAG: VanZ family protein [bacterium]
MFRKRFIAWGVVAAYTFVIYSTLSAARGISGFLSSLLGGRNLSLLIDVLYGTAGLTACGYISISRRGRDILSLLYIVLVAGIYIYFLDMYEAFLEKVHFLEYGLLGVFALYAFKNHLREKFALPSALILTGFLGYIDEVIQGILPNRTYDIRDVFLNALGGALGVATWRALTVDRRGAEMRRRIYVLAATLIAFFLIAHPLASEELSVHFIDVGYGDSALIQMPSGEDVLIDAGGARAGEKVVAFLRERGVEELDAIIATHPHPDHIGGMVEVIGNFAVNTLFHNGRSYLSQNPVDRANYLEYVKLRNRAKRVIAIEAGEQMVIDRYGDVRLTILHPDVETDDTNENSLIALLEFDRISFLFTGDTGPIGQGKLMASDIPRLVTVLKVNHHGSEKAVAEEFLEHFKPRIAVISVGENPHSRPRREVLERLKEHGVEVYRTDIDGDISISTNGERIEISCRKKED